MKRDFIFFSLYKSDDMQQRAGSAERSVSGSGVLHRTDWSRPTFIPHSDY